MNSDRHQKLTGVPNELILKTPKSFKAGARFRFASHSA